MCYPLVQSRNLACAKESLDLKTLPVYGAPGAVRGKPSSV